MKFLFKLRIIIVLIMAVIVLLLSYNYLSELSDEENIVISTVDIDERTWILPEMVKVIKIRSKDKQILAPSAFSSIEELNYAITKKKILKGQIINKDENIIHGTWQSLIDRKVVTIDGKLNNSYFISSNMRLTTIRVDSQASVFNKIRKGDMVDVIFSTTIDGIGHISHTIMQHIKVYSVENIEDDTQTQHITLELTPQQTVDLTFAKRNGIVDFVLNPSEGETNILIPVTIDKLLQFKID